jgi:hypothetical protein
LNADSEHKDKEPQPGGQETAAVLPRRFLTPSRRLGLWAVGIALATKLAILAWGIHVFPFEKQRGQTAVTIWSRWDGIGYLRIAETFYSASAKGVSKGEHELDSHFPPLYPLLIRLVKTVLPFSPLVSALLISWIAGLIAAYLLAQLAWHEFQDTNSVIMSVILFHVYPVSYFLITSYSESLYFLLIFAAFYFLRVQPRPFLCASSIGLGILTRLMAINLLPVLGLKLLFEIRARKRTLWYLLGLGIPLVAVGVYMAINYICYGSPLFFLQHVYADPTVPRKPAIPLRETVIAVWDFGKMVSHLKWDRFFMETLGWSSLFTAFVLLVTLWGIIKRAVPWEYSLYSVCYILFFSSFTWGVGNARYSFGAFPIFFILARAIPRALLWEWLVVSIGFLLYFSYRYVNGWWAF